MMDDDELFHVLALLRIEGVGDIMAKKLLGVFGSAKAVFAAKPKDLAALSGVGAGLLKNLKELTVFDKAEIEMKFIQKNNIKIFYYKNNDYPERLKHCFDAPVILFGTGTIDLKQRKAISIVGTRQVTSYGADFCRDFIRDLAILDPVIISGFAYGVDIVAHQAAIENNLQTIGILAHGHSQIYPKAHKKFVSKIEENGGFLTEFWSSTNPDKENFVRRNRIVAGITEATVVIESAEKGGSLITATMASDYNRDVFAVPGRVTDKYSKGCNDLIKAQKANLITSAHDLIYLLNWDVKKPEKTIQKKMFVEMEPEEQMIYDYLQNKGKELLDIIALDNHLPIFKLSSLLLNMELKGLIRPLPGKLFEAI